MSAPPPPNYGASMREILSSQVELMPRVFASEAMFQPKFAELQADVQQYLSQRGLDELKALYPQVAELERGYIQQTTQDELQRLQQQLPEYQKAFSSLTPGFGEALGSMGELARQAGARALERAPVTDYLSEVKGPELGQFVSGVGQYTPGADISGVQGPSEAGYLQGIQGPAATSGLENIDRSLVDQYVQTMPGMGQYAQRLSDLANAEIAAGRSLSPEEERMAQQAARQAYAARGTAMGPQSAAAEVLNRADVANRRLAQRMGMAQQAAGQVQGLYAPALEQALARQQAGAQYGLSAQAQRFGQAQTREGLAQDIQRQQYAQAMGREQLTGQAQAQRFEQAMGRENLASQAQQLQFGQALQRQAADVARQEAETQIQAGRAQLAGAAMNQLQGAQNPILNAFYKQPIMSNLPMGMQSFGLQGEGSMGPQLFNPESQTGMGSIYGAYNAQTQLAAANAAAKAQASAARSAMWGQIIGGGAMAGAKAMCWVAREVYGEHNPQWLLFREWMLTKAPKALLAFYITFGERIASFIKDKPTLKRLIKGWMDSKLA